MYKHRFDILSFHPGKQHNLEQACQLQKTFANFRHLTGLYFDKTLVRRLQGVAPGIAGSLKRRTAELRPNAVDTNPVGELKMLAKKHLGYTLGYPDYLSRNRFFQNWIIRKYGPPKVCIGFDTSSWKVFESWKGQSFLILDLTVALPHYKLTLAREYGLDAAFVAKQTHGDAPLYAIYERELALADLVLCGSAFVKNSCLSLGVAAEKLAVVPYGADLSRFTASEIQEDTDKVKIAFIGTVGYRKGADVVLKAWERLVQQFENVELHFFGTITMELPVCATRVYYHGFVPQEKLIAALRTFQISVLPSFLEGSSYAIYQSMALGLAVVTTPNAGSVIEHEENGLLVPYGDADALHNSLVRLITQPLFRKTLAQNAVVAIKAYTWDAYGNSLSQLIEPYLHTPASHRSL